MNFSPDWSGRSGDAWALRWRDTDRALAPLADELDRTIRLAAPENPFRALDVGCGPGTTSLALADARPDAAILGCDLSAALVGIARERATSMPQLQFRLGDAEAVAAIEGPFDLIFSRHGVMFFSDPRAAFATLRAAAAQGARLIFSCFRDWQANLWASQLASAAAGAPQAPPGREPSGFAFADVDYVARILRTAGWASPEHRAIDFRYVAGEGADAVDQALAFLSEIGPASQIVRGLDDRGRSDALMRMRECIARYCRDDRVEFPASAWIWSATAQV